MINIEDAEQSTQQDSAKSWRVMFESGNLQPDEIINFFQRQSPKFIAISTEEAGENCFLNFNQNTRFCQSPLPIYFRLSIFSHHCYWKVVGKYAISIFSLFPLHFRVKSMFCRFCIVLTGWLSYQF